MKPGAMIKHPTRQEFLRGYKDAEDYGRPALPELLGLTLVEESDADDYESAIAILEMYLESYFDAGLIAGIRDSRSMRDANGLGLGDVIYSPTPRLTDEGERILYRLEHTLWWYPHENPIQALLAAAVVVVAGGGLITGIFAVVRDTLESILARS